MQLPNSNNGSSEGQPNPMTKIVEEFVQKRQDYLTNKARTGYNTLMQQTNDVLEVSETVDELMAKPRL